MEKWRDIQWNITDNLLKRACTPKLKLQFLWSLDDDDTKAHRMIFIKLDQTVDDNMFKVEGAIQKAREQV